MSASKREDYKTHLTDVGAFKVNVFLRDKFTGEFLTDASGALKKQTITRAALAKCFHEYRVIGSHNGLFVVEV